MKIKYLLFAYSTLAVLFLTGELFPQAGRIDSTFGVNGIVTTTTFNKIATCWSQDIALQSDGKIVAVGYGELASENYFMVCRYYQDGTLDNSFGLNGTVITPVGDIGIAYSVVIQGDGKIIVGGSSGNISSSAFALVRYNPNGTLDPSFGANGKVITSLGTPKACINSIELQGDGKIVAAGYAYDTNFDFAVARYNSNGTLDNTFGTAGIVITTAVSTDVIQSISVQSDGKIVAGGRSNILGSNDFALARYNGDGTLDNTFGVNGIVVTLSGTSSDKIYSTALQPDGKIIAGGSSDLGGTEDFTLVRYNPDGTLDNTFGFSGVVITVSGAGDDYGNEVLVQPDGKIILAGSADLGGGDDAFALVRYSNIGEPDATFGTGGFAVTQIGPGGDGASSALLQSDGKIITGGSHYNGVNNEFASVRYNPDGSADNSYNGDGILVHDFGLADVETVASTFQAYGKIILAGNTFNGADDDFAFTRYNPDGELDSLFGTDGLAIVDIGTNNDVAFSVAIQADGKIVAAGNTSAGPETNFGLVRLNPDGQIDNTFGTSGTVTTSIGTFDHATSVLIQNDGKIIAAGAARVGANLDFAIVRYNNDGSLDNTFGTNGITTTSIGPGDERISSIILLSDGKIIAAGYSDNGTDKDFALIRYNTDGSLDNTFGSGGIVSTPIGASNDFVVDIAIQGDGKIVAAGYSQNGIINNFALARYNDNGSLDNSFGTNGIIVTVIGTASSYIHSVVIQTNGKIIAAGSSDYEDIGTFTLARYNPEGTLDLSFGTDGFVNTEIGSSYSTVYSMLLREDGKIIVSGCSYIDADELSSCAVSLVRYLGDPPVDVKNEIGGCPSSYTLEQNYPNPFNPVTNIGFSIPEAGYVSIKVFDVLGNEIAEIVKEEKPAGTYNTFFNAANLSAGVYFYRMQAGKFLDTKKFVVLK